MLEEPPLMVRMHLMLKSRVHSPQSKVQRPDGCLQNKSRTAIFAIFGDDTSNVGTSAQLAGGLQFLKGGRELAAGEVGDLLGITFGQNFSHRLNRSHVT